MKKGKEEGERGERSSGRGPLRRVRIVGVLDRRKEKKKKKKRKGNDPKGRSIERETEVGLGRTGGRTKILGEAFVRAGGIEVNKYSKKSRVPASGRRPTYNNHRSLQVSFAFQTFRSFILERE